MRDDHTDDQRRPPAWLFRAANPLVRALLRSPFHRLLSRRLMLLSYTLSSRTVIHSTALAPHPMDSWNSQFFLEYVACQ